MTGHLAIGIDVGGTKIAGGLVDLTTGVVITRAMEPTRPFAGPISLFERIWQVASTLAQRAEAPGVPVGIGVPELVDRDGVIRSAHLTDWSGFTRQAAIALDGRFVIASDVHAAASAEAHFGAIAGRQSALYVSIGTGISSALVIDGTVWRGHRGNALVLASSPVDGVIPEDVASGPGLVRLYAGAGGPEVTDAAAVLDAGDVPSETAIARAADVLSVNLGLAIDLLDPEIVVLGGGLGSATGRYRDALVSATRTRIWSVETRSVPFVPAELGADAGAIGAALATVQGAPVCL